MDNPDTVDLWSDEICALVDAAFETVSRNPSGHEEAVAYRRAILTALRAAQPTERGEWQDIATAPKDGTDIQAEIPGNGSDNVIAWQAEAFLDDDEQPCGGWAFTTDQEPPDCWTDGICWATNEDGIACIQPTRWKALAIPPEPSGQPVGEWQDIATAPKDGTAFLAHRTGVAAYIARQDCVVVHWGGWGGGVWDTASGGKLLDHELTHWQPLPKPPHQETDNGR